MLFSFGVGFSQSVTISGYVLDEENGNFIASASVFEKIDGIGTISNNNGFYKLILPPGQKQLKISNSGFTDFSKSFELKNDTILTVKLASKSFEKAKQKFGPVLGIHKTDGNSEDVSFQK
ncbi:MAG TPA: carboxypeptidase-like regulatory domain-containing protein [Prolixibacteraceae bacterium]|nr:carboxypeptidase-like regulatory domain-containing protein [Prolixibacteraceae bacterium]